MQKLLLLSEKDNVFTCMAAVKKGDSLGFNGINITAATDVPIFHKISKAFIKAGNEVCKYGEAIGIASRDIQPGEHVHIHNVESARGRGDKKRG